MAKERPDGGEEGGGCGGVRGRDRMRNIVLSRSRKGSGLREADRMEAAGSIIVERRERESWAREFRPTSPDETKKRSSVFSQTFT